MSGNSEAIPRLGKTVRVCKEFALTSKNQHKNAIAKYGLSVSQNHGKVQIVPFNNRPYSFP